MLIYLMPSNEYMRQYMAARRSQRRQSMIDLLGGTCVRCGTTENLQIDHVIPGSQEFRLNGKMLDKSWQSLLDEASKCQLLCTSCHRIKTREHGETGGGQNKNYDPQIHGTMRCYQETGCRCENCRQAKVKYRNHEISYNMPV